MIIGRKTRAKTTAESNPMAALGVLAQENITQLRYRNDLGMNNKLKIMLHLYSQNPKEINNGMAYTLLQKNGRALFIHSLPDRDDEIEMKSVWPKLGRVTTLLEGPYTRMDDSVGMGDPWDLSGWSLRLVK
jgi:hypothetical protein